MKRPVREKTLLQKVLNRSLREKGAIEIEGMGRFELEEDQVVFQPNQRVRIFLAYAKEDRLEVKKLYIALQRAGFEPWMDQEKLLPGQNWPRAIERAIDLADYVVLCFSRRSVGKRGYFQSELRYALDVAACVPLDEVFLMPIRLSECELPLQIAKKTQYVDFFPDWQIGLKALVNMIKSLTGERELRNR